MDEYKVLKSKGDIDLAFFLLLILCGLGDNWKRIFSQSRISYSLNKIIFFWRTFRSAKNHFEIFWYSVKEILCAAVFWSQNRSDTNGYFMHFM